MKSNEPDAAGSASVTATVSAGRLEYLDSIRGLAALSVVCSHYVLAFGLPSGTEHILTNSPLHFWWDGFAAVSLFFVLSGFVLSLRFFGPRRQAFKNFSYRDYLIARVFRIWAPYAFVFVASLVIWRYLKRTWPTTPESTIWLREFWSSPLSNFTSLREFSLVGVGQHQTVPQAWTLTIELLISFLVPFGALAVLKHLPRYVGGLVLLAVVAHFRVFALHFTAGIVLARVYSENPDWFRARVSKTFVPLFAAGFLLYTSRYSLAPLLPSLFPDRLVWYLTGLGSLLFLACTLGNEKIQAILLRPSLLFLGKISYSLYLCHFSILIAFTPAFLSLINRHGVSHRTTAWASGLIVTIALVVAVSALLEKWVEKPCIRLGKRLVKPV